MAVHGEGVHSVGHREGLEVALHRHGERQLVNEVNWRTRDDGPAAQVLQAQHSVGPPEALHAVPHEGDARELR